MVRPEETQPHTCPEGLKRNFLDCVRFRKPACYLPEVGHRSAAVRHVWHIAMILGETLKQDPGQERFAASEHANALPSRPVRAPRRL
jgi:hypothetical protein